MANPLTYGQEQAERNLEYWKILDQPMRKPTALASPEERRAYTAQQVRGGELPSYMLPEQYGGMPVGSTRRAIRARSQWADQQAQIEAYNQEMVAQQKALDDAYKAQFDQRETLRESARQDIELKLKMQEYEDKSDREDRIKKDALSLMTSLRGATLPNGQQLLPINPEDPEAISRLEDVATMNPYAFESPAAKAVWERRYNDALGFAKQNSENTQKQIDQQRTWLVGQQEEAASVGVDTTKFFTTKVDPQTNETIVTGVDQLGLSKAIGEAKRNDLETKKKEVAAAKIDEDSRSQARSVLDDISKIDSEIRKANFNAQKEKNSKLRDEHIANAEFYRSERDILVQRFNSLVPQQQSTQPQQTQQPQTTGQRPALGDIFGGR